MLTLIPIANKIQNINKRKQSTNKISLMHAGTFISLFKFIDRLAIFNITMYVEFIRYLFNSRYIKDHTIHNNHSYGSKSQSLTIRIRLYFTPLTTLQ